LFSGLLSHKQWFRSFSFVPVKHTEFITRRNERQKRSEKRKGKSRKDRRNGEGAREEGEEDGGGLKQSEDAS
jgi:hypothetical protein